MEKLAKIYVAGHRGMVGSALIRSLQSRGYSNIVVKTSSELDLRVQHEVATFFKKEKPDYVFLSAARVGGILANKTYKAEFIYDNIMIQNNVIHNSYLTDVKKLIFLGSSCIYPKLAPQPIAEESFLTGPLEESNDAYAIAKIAGIKMCEAYREQYNCNFISVMPTNLYGPNDNYDLANSHVLPALLRKFITAKNQGDSYVKIWGTGTPKREFLHVDDLASACIFLMESYDEPELINIGVGKDISIIELATLIKKIVGFDGEIFTDITKPDGTPRKLMNVAKITALGWKSRITLEEGIKKVYDEVKKLDWS